MSKTITLDRVPFGATFTLDGVRFVKLDGDRDAIFALTEDTPADLGYVQFEDDDATRDDHNNFNGSLVQKEIERWLRDKHKPIFDAVVERPIDLTAMDGMTDYGCPLTVGRILTIDEYRKHRRFIPLTDKPYWLATGWTTASSPNSSASYAYYINTDGTVYRYTVYGPYFAARPALYLQSQILVSVDTDEEEKKLEDYTELELLGELQRRVPR